MENVFSKKMSEKSDIELQQIIDNKGSYQQEAYLAAIYELEKRQLATTDILKQKDLILHETEKVSEEEEETVEKRKSFLEILEALIPTNDYFITPIIIYLNVLIYVIMVLRDVHPVQPTVESLIVWGGNVKGLTLMGQQWRLLSNIFLHGGILHLLFNMYALLYIGKEIETQFGKNRYLFTYVVTGIFASIASVSVNDNIVSVGASGAIFGMYGLLTVQLFTKNIIIPDESRKSFITSVVSFIAYNLLYGFSQEGIDNAAHFGGLIAGLALGGIYSLSSYKSRLSKGISIATSVVLLILIFVLPKLIPNKTGEYQVAMNKFALNEEKALWMHREDLSYIPENKIKYYCDRLDSEGVALWNENIEILGALSELPPHLEENISLLIQYCRMRSEACEIMKHLLLYNRQEDLDKVDAINLKIEEIINTLTALNQ